MKQAKIDLALPMDYYGAKQETPHIGARGSEVPVGNWLETVGANHVRFVGEGEGPPDFVVQFGGAEVAIEVTRMLDGKGWPENQRIAFERDLGAVIKMVEQDKDAPRWHVWCEYDPRVSRPPKPRGAWRELVKESLRAPGPGGAVQLIPDGSSVGRGVVLRYTPAGNAGGFSGVSMDTGNRPADTAGDRIVDVVASKARKVRKGLRARAFTSWWLVLDEEIVFVHSILGGEWENVEEGVRVCEGVEQWNKIVVFNRFTGSWRAVHERAGEPALPVFGSQRA